MDTSEKYIDICKKAVEIQKDWLPDNADFFGDPRDGGHGTVYVLARRSDWTVGNSVWLPRQDQLQYMVISDRYSPGRSTHHMLTAFICWYQHKTKTHPDSMEQIWLAFVMKEKYSKVWNGRDWVTED